MERRFVIKECAPTGYPHDFSIPESELKRRIDLAFRAAFCTLTETFDYAKAVEIIVHGEGVEGEEEHGLAYFEVQGLLAAKNGDWQRCVNFAVKWNHLTEPMRICDEIKSENQPSPTPSRKEWVAWTDRFPWVYLQDCTVMGTGYDNGAERLREWFKSMPIIPKE